MPTDLVVLDDVVRSARFLPVTNRWPERNGVAVIGELPLRWLDRSHDPTPTAAGTKVSRSPEPDRYVKRSLLDLLGHRVNEPGQQALLSHSASSPLTSKFDETL